MLTGKAFYDARDFDKAIEIFGRLVDLMPDSAAAHNNLGLAYLAIGRNQDATESFQHATQLDPANPAPWSNLGNGYLMLHRFSEAIDAYTHAIQLEPKAALAYYNLGTLYAQTGKLDEAIEALKESVRLDPNNANAFTNLGSSLSQVGRIEEAIQAYLEAVRKNPSHPGAYFLLGKTQYGAGRYQEAADALEKHTQFGMVDEEVYRLRGFAYLYLHRGEAAARDARACLKIIGWRNYSSPYMVFLGYFGYRLARQEEEAKKLLDEAVHVLDPSAWPFPVIRYLQHQSTSEEVLALANNTDERTEAHGYIGMDLLLSGSRQEALEHFQWIAEFGNRHFVEYHMSREEMKRMEDRSE